MKNSFKRQTRQNLTKPVFYVMLLTFIGSILGLLVQILIANYFGTSKEVDAFIVASIIPEFIYGITNAVLMTSWVVILTEYIAKHGEDKAWKFASSIFNVSIIGICSLVFLSYLFAPTFSKLLAPGFDLEGAKLTIKLMRLFSITILFYGLTSFTTGILYTKKSFFLPSLFKCLISISMISSVLFLNSYFGIFSLVIGIIIGTGIGFLSQIVALSRKIRYYPICCFNHSSLKKLVILAFPLVITSFLFYANKYISQIIASGLTGGAIAILNYAFLIVSFPAVFLSGSLSIVMFPMYAECVARQNMKEFKNLFSKSIKIIALFLIPLTICFIILGEDILRVLFERGMFDKIATSSTYLALTFYSTGLLAYGLNFMLCAAFYALKQMKTIAIMSLLMLIINAGLGLTFSNSYSYMGLALAMSIAYVVNTIIALFILKRKIGGFNEKGIFYSLLKIAIISYCLGGYIIILVYLTGYLNLNHYVSLIFILGTATMFYLIFIRLAKIEEAKYLFQVFKNSFHLKWRANI